MSEKELVLAVFENELAADDAAQSLKDTGARSTAMRLGSLTSTPH